MACRNRQIHCWWDRRRTLGSLQAGLAASPSCSRRRRRPCVRPQFDQQTTARSQVRRVVGCSVGRPCSHGAGTGGTGGLESGGQAKTMNERGGLGGGRVSVRLKGAALQNEKRGKRGRRKVCWQRSVRVEHARQGAGRARANNERAQARGGPRSGQAAEHQAGPPPPPFGGSLSSRNTKPAKHGRGSTGRGWGLLKTQQQQRVRGVPCSQAAPPAPTTLAGPTARAAGPAALGGARATCHHSGPSAHTYEAVGGHQLQAQQPVGGAVGGHKVGQHHGDCPAGRRQRGKAV